MVAAVVLVVAGLAVAAFSARDDFGSGTAAKRSTGASTRHTTSTQQTTTEQTTEAPSVDGIALGNQGYALQQAGNYAAALPLLRQSVLALAGSGVVQEAWADYNLAYTRFALGRCDGVMGLLARSERIQGHRPDIDELRRRWEERCGSSDEQAAPGHGRGKDKGKGKGHDG